MERSISLSVVDRIISWSLDKPLPALTRYLAATLSVAVTALVRATLITSILPWLLFIPIILMVALTMGRRTGFYAVLLSAFAAVLTIPHPGATYWLTGQQWVASLLFIAICAFIVTVGAELRAAFRRGKRLSEEREELAREREHAYALLIEKDEQSQLLNHELGHRLKNLLTIVQAVASQTIRQSADLLSAEEALSFRLAALGRAADVLTASAWEAADLHDLAHAALANHVSLADRFVLTGPPVRFKSQIALALALAFHELTTNATKYGALSNDTGNVAVKWSVEQEASEPQPRFRLMWREAGGPAILPPTRRGFGSLMIEKLLRSYLRGTTSVEYKPDGLEITIDAPLTGALAEDRS